MTKNLVINGIQFPANKEKTLLENLESNGIQADFQCRDGHCGACQTRLVKGTVEYTQDPLAYIRQGFILTCCSKAKDNVELALPEQALAHKKTG